MPACGRGQEPASSAWGQVVSLSADPSSLDLEALAHRGDYTALAALVYHTDVYDALGTLAASAREPEALRWVVALLARKLPPEGYQAHEQAEQQAYVSVNSTMTFPKTCATLLNSRVRLDVQLLVEPDSSPRGLYRCPINMNGAQ